MSHTNSSREDMLELSYSSSNLQWLTHFILILKVSCCVSNKCVINEFHYKQSFSLTSKEITFLTLLIITSTAAFN